MDHYGVSYGSLVPVLVEAIKEQQSQIDALRAEIAALKSSPRNGAYEAVRIDGH
jgi:hypothetical protein